nr:hypothetical protein CFP56_62509 [Quercus suber]
MPARSDPPDCRCAHQVACLYRILIHTAEHLSKKFSHCISAGLVVHIKLQPIDDFDTMEDLQVVVAANAETVRVYPFQLSSVGRYKAVWLHS